MLEIVNDEWTVVLLDLSGQEILDISRYTDFTLDLKLNDVSTLSFNLDAVQFERSCTNIGTHPRNVLYPQRTEIRVYLNDTLKFGGTIASVNTDYGVNDAKMTCKADSYLQYFSKRHVKKNYVSTQRSNIAWDAINTVQSVTNGNLGVTQGTLATTYASDLTADYKDVKSIIMLYTYAQPTTYDFEITPDKVFNTYTRLGSDKPEIELIYPGNIASLGVPRNADSLANKVIGLGAGIGAERLETVRENATSQLRYRVLESKPMFNSVEKMDTLINNTDGVLNESYEVLVIPNVKPRPGEIDLETTIVGDSVRVAVLNFKYDDDIDGMFRIYAMSITVDKMRTQDLTLDFYKPDAGGGVE